MSKRRWMEFIIDPQSGQFSASRLCLVVLILLYLPFLIGMEATGHKLGVWMHFGMIVSAVCGAYGANSALRVWRGSPPQQCISSIHDGSEKDV